jgi:hypothetical protein
MTKSSEKPINIKDLPPPKGYDITGGTGKRKELKPKGKEKQTDIEKLPG